MNKSVVPEMPAFRSWGRQGRPRHEVKPIYWAHQNIARPAGDRGVLPYGMGRSYGDCCLNDRGRLLWTRHLDRFIAFDREQGRLRCETGVTLGEILGLILPQGWFLPVSPGTRFVTLGGAIANDVHGKNHHRAGSFGCHVRSFTLIRSDGSRYECSPSRHPGLFAATIGGLGLTGLMVDAEIQLKKVDNAYLMSENKRFASLDEFFSLSDASAASHEYTVAWIDSLAQGSRLGRGVFMRANHAAGQSGVGRNTAPKQSFAVPVTPPVSLVQPAAMGLFNKLYFQRAPARFDPRPVHYAPFFYPLDGIRHWNRLYGPRGFFQFQCVIPPGDAKTVLMEILRTATRARQGSFLAVLKVFGESRSPGLLSFPRPGTTLALDFPDRGAKTRGLFQRLHRITREAGGGIYPAKDMLMEPALFEQSFPALDIFKGHRDPGFSSDMWRRVNRG